MKYCLIIVLPLLLLSSCGGKKAEESHGGTVPLGSGTTIPVLKKEKARKAKLTFDLTEVIRKEDKVDVVMMVSNRSDETMVFYDNNGYIYKVSSAKIDKINQFGAGMRIAKIPEHGKVKSVISFTGVREDATSGQLFFKGEANRGKTLPFKVQFNKVQIKD
jgi:DNA gyrase/topoisomerase IV subunit A